MKKAFTLLELLVVIAIILILMTISLPVLSNMKENGRSLVCKSNLHAIGMATHHYYDTFRTIPYIESTRPDWEEIRLWDLIDEVWACPSDKTKLPIWYHYYAKSIIEGHGRRKAAIFYEEDRFLDNSPLPLFGDSGRVHLYNSANQVNMYGVTWTGKIYSNNIR